MYPLLAPKGREGKSGSMIIFLGEARATTEKGFPANRKNVVCCKEEQS